MKKLPLLLISISALIAFSNVSYAQTQICYEDITIPAHMSCDSNAGASVDFTTGCRNVPDTVVQVTVACPPEAEWVNVSQSDRARVGYHTGTTPYGRYMAPVGTSTLVHYANPTHSEVCAKVGMIPSDIDGQVCASGKNRPISGENFQYINYIYGTTGAAGRGGTLTTRTNHKVGYTSMLASPWFESTNACWNGASSIVDESFIATPSYNWLGRPLYYWTDVAVAFACIEP